MKKAWVIVLILVIGSFKSNAQDTEVQNLTNRNDHFYFAPIDLFFNTLQIGYERDLKNHNSIALLGGFKLSKSGDLIERVGGTGEIQYRINLMYNKEGLSTIARGQTTFLYFAPFIQYRYEEANDEIINELLQPDREITYVNSGFAGLGFGVRLSGLENRFSLNLFAGGGIKYSDINGNGKYADFTQMGYTGIAPKISCQIGIAF